MARKQWTETEKGAILAWFKANGNHIRQTARQFNLTPSTLVRWVHGQGINDDVRKTQQEKNNALDAIFEREARAAMLAAPLVRNTANYSQLLTGAAISVDKMRLLREQSTAINEQHLRDADDEAILASADAIRTKLRSLPGIEDAPDRFLPLHDADLPDGESSGELVAIP